MAIARRNYWEWKRMKRLGLIVLCLWIIHTFLSVLSLPNSRLLEISDTYYANVPTTDAIKIVIPGIISPLVPARTLIESTRGIPLTVKRSGNLLTVSPLSGRWPKNSTVTLNIRRPGGPLALLAAWTTRKGFGDSRQYAGSVTFATAGPFTIVETKTSGDINPQTGFEIRFNERVADPSLLASYISVTGVATVSAVVKETSNAVEKNLVFLITSSQFTYNKSYTLTVRRGLSAQTGETLATDVTRVFHTAKNPKAPQVHFGDDQVSERLIVKPDDGKEQSFHLGFLNVSSVTLTLYKAKPVDAINYLVYSKDSEDDWSRESSYSARTTGMPKLWQETIQDPKDGDVKLPTNLSRGLYILEALVWDGENPIRTQVFINITRLGAVAKVGTTKTIVWVSDVFTGVGVGNSTVRLYSLSGGAFIQESAVSDASGLAELTNPGKSDLGVVFADDDVAFVPLLVPGGHIGRAGSLPDYEGFWGTYPDPKRTNAIKSYLTTDRPIYKPGDTLLYKAVIRKDRNAQYEIPKPSTVEVVLRRDYWSRDGEAKPILSDIKTSNEFGSVWGEFQLNEELKPGNYYLSIKRENTTYVSQGIVVSDYRKPLYHMEATLDETALLAGDTIKAKITGTFSFGSPLKDKTVTWTLYSDPVWSHYNSGNEQDPYDARSSWYGDGGWWNDTSDYHNKQIASGTVTLNGNGEGYVNVPIASTELLKKRQSRITLVAEIIDSGVAPERVETKGLYKPSDLELAITATDHRKNRAFMTTRLVGADSAPARNVSVTMTGTNLLKEETQTTNADGTITWSLSEKFGKSRGSSDFTLTWKDAKGKQEEYQTSFWEYAYEYDADTKSRQSYIAEAEIVFPDAVRYNETAPLTVKQGGKQHLVVFARDDIIDAFVVGDNQTKDVTISDRMMPNAFLSTYSFRDGLLSTGYQEIRPVDLSSYRKIQLTVTPDKGTYGPGERAAVTIETLDTEGKPVSAEVNLTIVDKSIYDLKKSSTKPIHPEFYRRRMDETVYGVNLSGIWEWAGGGRGGGGGGGGGVREVFVDTAYTKPDIVTDVNGRARIEFTLPDNLTTWITDAYAVTTQTQVGESHGEFRVTRPVFVLPVFPSFITQGDDVGFGAVVGNTTEETQTIKTSFAFAALAPPSNPTQSITLTQGSTSFLRWQMRIAATEETGPASYVATTQPGGPMDAVNMKIPIKPQGKIVASRESGIGAASIKPRVLDGVDVAKSKAYLTVTTGILGYVSDILTYQAGYPYGCVEQTMSRFYPTLLVSTYLPDLTITKPKLLEDLPDMVEKGVTRLSKLQHEDGGWGLWEQDESSLFNTAYVVSGLTEVKNSVPLEMLVSAKKYMELAASRNLTPGESVIVLSALAKLKSPFAQKIADTLPDSGLEAFDDAEISQAAIALFDIKHARAKAYTEELIRRAQPVGESQVRWNAGRNYAYHPHENLTVAFAIQALLRAHPSHEYIPKALTYLNTHRNMNMYGSTYANAQVVKAFIEYSKRLGGSTPSYTLAVVQGGVEKVRTSVAQPNTQIGPIEVNSVDQIEIIQQGTGTLLWDLKVDNAFGALGTDKESSDIALTRSYKNTSRASGELRVGDIIDVTLTVKNRSNRDLHDVVIDDSLPAGLEAINSLLDNQRQTYTSRDKNRWPWYATEIHSDTVAMFPYVIAPGRTETLTYVARAYLPGTFTANPASALLMYEPGVPALTKSETLKIVSNE